MRSYLLVFIAICSLPSLQGIDVLASGNHYWNEPGGGFRQEYTAMNYQRSSYFLQGGLYWSVDDPTANKTLYPELFTQAGMATHVYDPSAPAGRTNDLYPIPKTTTELAEWIAADPTNEERYRSAPDGKIQVKMSTFYYSGGTFDNGTAGYNPQYDRHRAYHAQSHARNYSKTAAAGVEALIWLTPYGYLKEYMTNPDPTKGPARGQWSHDRETLKNFKLGADTTTKNFTSGDNPYNRAAAALGMLNGTFKNPEHPTDPSKHLGFGNFYRVADLWIHAEDIARTSVESSWQDNTIVSPADYDDQEHRPVLRSMSPDSQVEKFGYWGPQETSHQGNQQQWHHDMVQSYSLKPSANDDFELTSSTRGGAYQWPTLVTENELATFLDPSQLEEFNQWKNSHTEDPLTLKRHLWSSNNDYHHFQNAFYPYWWETNTKTGVFPWTGHGYTYDWYYGHSDPQYDHLAGSTTMMTNSFPEFIVRPGAEFEVEKTAELVEYLTGNPAPYQPTAIPEPATSLLAMIAFVLWGGRWKVLRGGTSR